MELHRGRLLDHVQLVVRDLPAAERFYTAVAAGLGIPVGGRGEGFVWIDELVLSALDSPAALGEPTGRHHLAFQAPDRETVEAVYQAALAAGGAGQRRTGTAALSSGLLRRFRAGSRRQQYRGGLSRPRPAQCAFGTDLLRPSAGSLSRAAKSRSER